MTLRAGEVAIAGGGGGGGGVVWRIAGARTWSTSGAVGYVHRTFSLFRAEEAANRGEGRVDKWRSDACATAMAGSLSSFGIHCARCQSTKV